MNDTGHSSWKWGLQIKIKLQVDDDCIYLVSVLVGGR